MTSFFQGPEFPQILENLKNEEKITRSEILKFLNSFGVATTLGKQGI